MQLDLDANGDIEVAAGALFDNDGGTNRGAVYVLRTATPLPEPGAALGLGSGIGLFVLLGRLRRLS